MPPNAKSPEHRRFGAATSLIVILVCGVCWAVLSSADVIVGSYLPSEKPLAFTVRLPIISLDRDRSAGSVNLKLKKRLFARGQTLDPDQLRDVRSHREFRASPTPRSLLRDGLLISLLILLFSIILRAAGGVAAFLRTQMVILGLITELLLIAKGLMMFTTWSAMWMPMVCATMVCRLSVSRRVARYVAVLCAVALSLLIPFDLLLFLVMLVQGLTASASVHPSRRTTSLLIGASASSMLGAMTYVAVLLLFGGSISSDALHLDAVNLGVLLDSDLAGSMGSALIGGVLSFILLPLIRSLLGHLSRGQLKALADLEHPLLKRLAAEAPGTWSHSTNVASMAEMAANRIGVDGLLLRVGAYYHDVGKCLRSNHFAENQGENTPQDILAPDISSLAMRRHVNDGVKIAREHDLPQVIVAFIYTHHGNERLEYLWRGPQSSVDLLGIVEEDFRHSGVPPQTKEQGILSICDAVETASRAQRAPNADQIEEMVRQAIFNKLKSGVLDHCGLSTRELRLIGASCVESLSMDESATCLWKEPRAEKG